MYLPRVPRSLSFVKVCARSLALRHQSLTFCARLFAKPCEKRSAWGGDCWLMYYLTGRHPSMLNFAVSIIFFCLPQLMSTALMDLFRVNWLRLNNKNQKLRRGWRTFYMSFCKSTNKTLKLVGRAGSASRLDSGLLKRGKRTELKKDVVSWTLKGYLSLSVQSVHICIVICLFIHFVCNFKDRTTMREKEFPGPLGTLVGTVITLREL